MYVYDTLAAAGVRPQPTKADAIRAWNELHEGTVSVVPQEPLVAPERPSVFDIGDDLDALFFEGSYQLFSHDTAGDSRDIHHEP
jgi:hypothetical protein